MGRISDIQGQQTDIQQEGRDINRQVDYKRKQLEDMSALSRRRFEALGKEEPETARAVEWLREHKDKFEQHVFEPACLSLQVRDQRYVDAVEFALGGIRGSLKVRFSF